MSLAARSRPGDRECPQGAPGVQQEEQAMNSMARRMFDLVEPIGVVPYSADDPNEAMFALGFTNYWDTYFAGRAAPLGIVPEDVVDRLFHAASLLREHRGDGHIAALMVEGVGGLEAHVLLALDMNMP